MSCLSLALHCLGVSVPLANAQEDDSMWYTVSIWIFCGIFLRTLYYEYEFLGIYQRFTERKELGDNGEDYERV